MAALREYESLVNLIRTNDNISKSTLYEKLMKKEDKTINLLNRIAEYETTKELKSKNISNFNISKLVHSFLQTWKLIIHDLLLLGVNKVTLKSIILIFYEKDRQFYVGVMMVMIAFFLFFLDIST